MYYMKVEYYNEERLYVLYNDLSKNSIASKNIEDLADYLDLLLKTGYNQ